MRDKPTMNLGENVAVFRFMLELIGFLKERGLFGERDDPEIPHKRAATVMITVTYCWYISGRIDTEEETSTEFF